MPAKKPKPAPKKMITKAEAEAPPIEKPKSPYEALPCPGTPPPALANYRGREELKRLIPEHVVTLDAGVFMYLWRMVEARALEHHNSATVRQMVPEQYDVSLRAVTAFRTAAGTVQAKAADVSGGRKKTFGRKT